MLAGEPPYTGPTAQVDPDASASPTRCRACGGCGPNVPEGGGPGDPAGAGPGAGGPVPDARPSSPQALQTVASHGRRHGDPDRLAQRRRRRPRRPRDGRRPGQPPVAAAPSAARPQPPGSPRPARRLPVGAITLGLGFAHRARRPLRLAADATRRARRRARRPKVLAVLPFENLGDSARRLLRRRRHRRGAGQALAAARARGHRARPAPTSTGTRTKRPQQIARELGADYLLTATVRWEKVPRRHEPGAGEPRAGRREPGHRPAPSWQQPFDASLTDVFQVQADIATKVASALNVALGDSARHELAAKPTANLAAYDAFLKGEAASQAHGGGGSGESPARHRLLPAGGGARLGVRPGLGPARPRAARTCYCNSTPTPASWPQTARQAAERAQALGARPARGAAGAGRILQASAAGQPAGARGLRGGAQAGARQRRAAHGRGAGRAEPGPLGGGAPAPPAGAALDPRSASYRAARRDALLYLRRYPEALAATRPGPRARPHQPRTDRGPGDGGPGPR